MKPRTIRSGPAGTQFLLVVLPFPGCGGRSVDYENLTEADIPVLIEHLTDPTQNDKAKAAIVRFGEAAVPALIDGGQDPENQPAVLDVLASIGTPAVPKLPDARKSSDANRMSFAADAIGRVSPWAIPVQIEVFQSTPGIRHAAGHAFGRIGSSTAKSPLETRQDSGDAGLRRLAGSTLGSTGRPAVREPDPKIHAKCYSGCSFTCESLVGSAS